MKLPDFLKEPKRSELLRRYNPNRWSGFNLLLSFLLPFLGIMVLFFINDYAPFSTGKALIYSDEFHQYYPFYLSFRRAIFEGKGLLWNWDVGMGMDFMGMYSYYLASPLNWLSLLIPDSFALQYFTLMMPLKIGFAGLFFGMFLKGVFKKNDFSIAVFGSFYATCAFVLAYQWNIMWLDSFALLPLVMLGMVLLLREKKFIIYTVALLFAFMSNYYIGYIVCLFTLLAFICHEVCRWPGFVRFAQNFGRMALFSILAIGMSLVITLPGLTSLLQTQSTANAIPDSSTVVTNPEESKSEMESVMETFGLNIVGLYETNYWEDYHEMYSKAEEAWNAFSDANELGDFSVSLLFDYVVTSIPLLNVAMARVAGNLGGGQELGLMEGLPNIYCGVVTIILAFLFLTAKEVKIQDKICSVLMVLFLMFSFIFRQLDYIWHGFHFTNMIPYRFSFLLSFVLLYMAYRAWILRSKFSVWQILLATVGTLFVLSCSENREDITFLAYNGIFLLLTVAVLLIDRFEPRATSAEGGVSLQWLTRHERVISCAMLCVLCLELIMNIASFGNQFPYTDVTNYPKSGKDTAAVVEYMKKAEKDSDFYRTETTHAEILNDGALLGFNGISTFSSSANRRVNQYVKYLGQAALAEWNRYCYEDSSPVSNLFLNLKYLIERNTIPEPNSYFDPVYNSGSVTLLKNNAYLPLGFMVDPAMAELDVDSVYNVFHNQNVLFNTATGLQTSVWEAISTDNCAVVSEGDVNLNNQNSSGYCTYSSGANGGTVHFQYTADREGFLCLNLDFSADNTYSIYIKRLIDDSGDEPVYSSFSLVQEDIENLPQMAAVCDVKPGDFVELNVFVNGNESGTINVANSVLNETVFRHGYDILNTSTMDIQKFSSTRIQGTINCKESGLLYTSIPSDGNWKVKVDGKDAKITLIGNAMVGVMLTKGKHEITFVYQNKAFLLGLGATIFCLAAFILIIFLDRRRQAKVQAAAPAPAMEQLPVKSPAAPVQHKKKKKKRKK